MIVVKFSLSCQVYKRYGNDLCIVCTNVSSMCVEYFHPKTTPDVPVALAVRASSALPGTPTKTTMTDKADSFYAKISSFTCFFKVMLCMRHCYMVPTP